MVYATYLKMAQQKYVCGWVCKESQSGKILIISRFNWRNMSVLYIYIRFSTLSVGLKFLKTEV